MRNHSFKVGDKVVISTFPMRMSGGGSDECKAWYESGKVFTITAVDVSTGRRSDELMVHVAETSWYYSPEDMMLAKDYKRPKRINSWKLERIK